jgi:hypothetical protein
MTGQQFSRLIREPALIDSQSADLVENLVERYPYCQSGHLLLACILYSCDSPNYPLQLKKAAAYAGDRRILKNLIEHTRDMRTAIPEQETRIAQSPQPIPEAEPQALYPRFDQTAFVFATPAYEPLTQEELLSIVRKRLAEINLEKKQEQTAAELHHPGTGIPESGSTIPEPVTPPTKSSLIEKFIQDEPRISKPRASFFNPTESALRSNFDEEEIVSETLAQLYAQQGNIQKAKHIYEKLSLINQEKSRYFAAQIEKLST